MECCIGVSTETVLQIYIKFYIVVKIIFKLTFRTSTVILHSDEGLYNLKCQFKNYFHYNVELNIYL